MFVGGYGPPGVLQMVFVRKGPVLKMSAVRKVPVLKTIFVDEWWY